MYHGKEDVSMIVHDAFSGQLGESTKPRSDSFKLSAMPCLCVPVVATTQHRDTVYTEIEVVQLPIVLSSVNLSSRTLIVWRKRDPKTALDIIPTPAGFEPAPSKRNRFLICRRNHLAIAPCPWICTVYLYA